MEIQGAVTDCTIIYKYLDWIPGTSGKKQYYEDKFKTIAALKDYFTRYPSAGALVGYGKAPAGSRWAFEAVLMLQWNGRQPVEFINVFAFVRFLEEHPPLAKAVEYVPKKKL